MRFRYYFICIWQTGPFASFFLPAFVFFTLLFMISECSWKCNARDTKGILMSYKKQSDCAWRNFPVHWELVQLTEMKNSGQSYPAPNLPNVWQAGETLPLVWPGSLGPKAFCFGITHCDFNRVSLENPLELVWKSACCLLWFYREEGQHKGQKWHRLTLTAELLQTSNGDCWNQLGNGLYLNYSHL